MQFNENKIHVTVCYCQQYTCIIIDVRNGLNIMFIINVFLLKNIFFSSTYF